MRVLRRGLLMIVMLAAVAMPTPASGAASPEIEVTPAVDLVDGQAVAVSGAGWAPGAAQVFQCVVTGSEVATACVYRRHVNVRDDGTFTTQIPVAARLWDETTGEVIDCRERTDCGIRMLSTAEIAIVEHPLAFNSDAPLEPAPTLVATPSDDLSDDQEIQLTGAHLQPQTILGEAVVPPPDDGDDGEPFFTSVVTCPAGFTSLLDCDRATWRPYEITIDGSFSGDYRVTREIQLDDGTPYDCSVGAGCVLLTGSYPDPLTHTTVPIRFGSSQTSTSTTQATTSTTSAAATAPTVQPRFTG